MKNIEKIIFKIKTIEEFNSLALYIFKFQVENNKFYREYVLGLGKVIKNISNINQIPFLPIDFFKTKKIYASNVATKKIFYSSGTTLNIQSKHYIKDLKIYENSLQKCFEYFYNSSPKYHVLALLPSYLENKNSSLIFMINKLIRKRNSKYSRFYKYNIKELAKDICELDNKGKKIILIGVSYALLDLAENNNFKLKNTIVMETGGMKGRRKEMPKEQLHKILKKKLGVDKIHSEYGMTELLSQSYSKGDSIFETPPWMQIKIREHNDPFCLLPHKKQGAINIIDLANIYSCSFIATDDLGISISKNKFKVLGRLDNSDIRGCNLLLN